MTVTQLSSPHCASPSHKGIAPADDYGYSDPGPTLGCGLGGFRSGQAPLFQEHEDHPAELLPVAATYDGLLVGRGDGDGIAHTVEQPSLVPGLQRSALPRFHRRGYPAPSLPSWLETALFTAPAGNSRHLCSGGWLETPVYFSLAGRYTFAHSSQGCRG